MCNPTVKLAPKDPTRPTNMALVARLLADTAAGPVPPPRPTSMSVIARQTADIAGGHVPPPHPSNVRRPE